MGKYILKRLLMLIFVIIGVVILVFTLLYFTKGDPARQILGPTADDEAVESFGVRTLTWGKDGLLLNGQRVILRGACVHHDNGLLGAACLPDAVERKVRLLKEKL